MLAKRTPAIWNQLSQSPGRASEFAIEVVDADPDAGARSGTSSVSMIFSMIEGVGSIADHAQLRQRHKHPVHVGKNEFSGETLIK